MTTLYLIRHGETDWNADGRFQGQQNTALNAAGRAQAAMVAGVLATRPIDAIYSSDLARALETADKIALPHRLTPIADSRLREAYFGEWEGHTLPEVEKCWPAIFAAWRADGLHTRPPGGETLEMVAQRATAVMEDILRCHPRETIAIVAHVSSLRAIITRALGADLTTYPYWSIRLDNCSITTIEACDGKIELLQLNDIGHL